MLRRKYQQEKPDLIQDIIHKGRLTAILSIKLQGISKIADHYIYEVRFLDNGTEKTVPIIAFDVTQALGKLEP